MPPSGYSPSQSQYAVDFLTSCFRALVAEADEKSLSLREALRAEIGNIHAHLESDTSLPSQEAILRLTLTFYEALYDSGAADNAEITRLSLVRARDIGADILAIKVDEHAYTRV